MSSIAHNNNYEESSNNMKKMTALLVTKVTLTIAFWHLTIEICPREAESPTHQPHKQHQLITSLNQTKS